MSSDYNEVVFTFSFARDKCMGRESWQEDIELLRQICDRLEMNEGRRSASISYSYVGDEELDWNA